MNLSRDKYWKTVQGSTLLHRARHSLRSLVDFGTDLAGLAIIVIAFLIGAGVLMHVLGISRIATLDEPLWLIGRRITFNTLMGLQTLLFAFAVMLMAALTWVLDRHVRVDFFYARLSRFWQSAVNFSGTLLLALPFVYFLLEPAYNFAERSHRLGESSTDGGLAQLWVLKALVPAGFWLMFLVGLWWLIKSFLMMCQTWRHHD